MNPTRLSIIETDINALHAMTDEQVKALPVK